MRPGLAREVVRDQTAYPVGRSVVDIGLALQWTGTVILLVLFFKGAYELPGSPAELASASVVVGSAVAGSIIGLALRELAHAVFERPRGRAWIRSVEFLKRKRPGNATTQHRQGPRLA